VDARSDVNAPDRASAEALGPGHDREMMLLVRQKTRRAMHEIASAISPGMLEEEAMQLARTTLQQAGMRRGWHAIHVRFGPNTLKPFGVPSEPGVRLGDDDIFFLDIGPVWQGWEGDAGDTFVVGHDADMHRAARDVRRVFDEVHETWRSQGLTGEALYRHAAATAASMGWELNLEMSGHRLADFPHAALYDGTLASAPFRPSTALWVLEIQIRHPERPFSAFYEDLLLDEYPR
jgi:Xaa-Pro aminopeptidase